jgi:hypothetical protein
MTKISHVVARDVFIGAIPNIKQAISFVISPSDFRWDEANIFDLQKVPRAIFRFLLCLDGRAEKQETQKRTTQLPAHTPVSYYRVRGTSRDVRQVEEFTNLRFPQSEQRKSLGRGIQGSFWKGARSITVFCFLFGLLPPMFFDACWLPALDIHK